MTLVMFFFFKQKTAYEMRISDWSSDVCSSDVLARKQAGGAGTDGFAISMPTLFEKSGAEGDYRRFKFEMTKIARENALPSYALEIELRGDAEPFLRMIRRDPTSEREAPSPAPVQAAPAHGRSIPSAQAKAPDAPAIAFPEYGHIAHSAFGAIARANLPEPQRDHGMVADDFRSFLRQREIAYDANNITQIFATFCSKQRAAL